MRLYYLCFIIFVFDQSSSVFKERDQKQKEMKSKNHFSPYSIDNIHQGFSVDCVILCFHKKKIQVLLNKFSFSKYWQLPGGFMFKEESADDAAKRILIERTCLTGIYLKQFFLFSDPNRIAMDQNIEYMENDSLRSQNEKWFLQRFVTLGYYALVKFANVHLPSSEDDTSRWFDIDALPELYSDHRNIINKAIESIQSMLPILPVAYELLPEKFTMSELRKIYESFLGKTLDRRNFQRKVLASGIIVQLDETKNNSSYNPPILYAFKEGEKDMVDPTSFLK